DLNEREQGGDQGTPRLLVIALLLVELQHHLRVPAFLGVEFGEVVQPVLELPVEHTEGAVQLGGDIPFAVFDRAHRRGEDTLKSPFQAGDFAGQSAAVTHAARLAHASWDASSEGGGTVIDLRLVAYAPNGARLGQLPHPSAVGVGSPLNAVPSLRVSYAEHAVGAEHLGQPCEVAVEIWDGTAWTEHPDSRFLRIGREGDETDRTGARSYTLPGYGWMLRKLLLYPPDDPLQLVDGKRPFWSATVGQILQTFLAEGHARGALPGLDWDFTTTHDSAGQPWAKVLTIYYDPGSDLLAAVMNLAEQGLCDWRLNGRTLQVFNEGTVLGRDLASGAGPVDLRYGRDIDESPTRGTLEDLASAVLLKGEGSFNVEVVN